MKMKSEQACIYNTLGYTFLVQNLLKIPEYENAAYTYSMLAHIVYCLHEWYIKTRLKNSAKIVFNTF